MSDLSTKFHNLSSALYLITSFFNDNEPLKWKLRSLCSDLVIYATEKKDSIQKDRNLSALRTKELSSEIMNLLILAKNAGLVSDVNNDLIQQEFNNNLNQMDIPKDISSFLNSVKNLAQIGESKSEIVLKDKINFKDDNYDNYKQREISLITREKAPLKEFGAVSVKKNTRQSVIISVLKKKREVMIKDISPLVQNCSEKTIQRELQSMVQAGILKKTGEKRWSRYSLA